MSEMADDDTYNRTMMATIARTAEPAKQIQSHAVKPVVPKRKT